ncbi:hypothetical protein E1A91_A07G201300v1 [Gossypium mustelinum]|uniref:Uncharacterized protein n=1 Tax=Gossypium mustelinum TaxID=34275 RepID=A0A5D2YRC0_GOSMU|nr:hypothetical protein E1A91_A07G201300v1 [Gossypium mustelinum]TYJ27641.1 hypothetical protein E1A91_A07G201300v1 [Gossypium mustelinum]TYJ27642.1 hypothetical protein E1A91_A07G201300v1 [Gossypium mustelinum]TYJ27644.1 hypothetical protein E1A91_A07G201300v1 [Gossypium mustelinum]
MDMLPSFILYPLINGGSHLSNFHSFSSSSNTIATHIEALSNKPMSMPVRGKGKRDHRFDNVDDTLIFSVLNWEMVWRIITCIPWG